MTGVHVTWCSMAGRDATKVDFTWCDVIWHDTIILFIISLLYWNFFYYYFMAACVFLCSRTLVFIKKKKKEIRWMRIRENWNPKTFWSRRTSLLFEKLIQPQQHWPGSVSYFLPSLMKSVPFLEYLKIRNEKEWKKWMTHFSQHKGVI